MLQTDDGELSVDFELPTEAPMSGGPSPRTLAAAAAVGLEVREGDAVLVVSPGGVLEAGTEHASAIVGFPLAQLVGHDLNSTQWTALDEEGRALRPEDHPKLGAMFRGGTVRGAVVGIHREMDPAGQNLWIEVDALPIDGNAANGYVVRVAKVRGTKEAELQLAASERLYRFLVESAPDMVAWQLPDSTFLWVSPAAHSLLGYDPSELVGRRASELLHPDDVRLAGRKLKKSIDGSLSRGGMDLRMRHKDGSYRWMEVVGSPLHKPDGGAIPTRTAWRDISDRIDAEQERDAALRMVRSTIDSSPMGIAVCGEDGVFIEVNRALCTMFGRDAADLVGLTLREFTHPSDHVDGFGAVLSGEVDIHTSESRYRRSDGTWMWGQCNLVMLRDDDISLRSVLVQIQDVTERRFAIEQLAHAATHDWLTGLPNRQALTEHLARFVEQRAACPSAMIFVDLDEFKSVNDTYGHEVGDKLLTEVANRLREAIREQDFIARLGGDEFVVHCSLLGDRQEAESIAERIFDALRAPFVIGTVTLLVSASIGVATVSDCDATQLMKHADRAMYRAKKRGRARIEVELLP